MNPKMLEQMSAKPGFIAALDQSGGSSPGALKAYGIPENAYSGDDEMFALMHAMRVRIVTSRSFTGDHIIGAILFERTMDGEADGMPVPSFLWERKGVVSFLKIDKGLEPQEDGVNLMKPIPGLEQLLLRARNLGIFGTKMRSTIAQSSPSGIKAIVDQQFALANQIADAGLMPILEPEALISSAQRPAAEAILLERLTEGLDRLPAGRCVMIKLTIPSEPNLYAPLIAHKAVTRVVALSGGFARRDACKRLAANDGMIASFSRALIGDLRVTMDDATFDAALAAAIDQIYSASVIKRSSSSWVT